MVREDRPKTSTFFVDGVASGDANERNCWTCRKCAQWKQVLDLRRNDDGRRNKEYQSTWIESRTTSPTFDMFTLKFQRE